MSFDDVSNQTPSAAAPTSAAPSPQAPATQEPNAAPATPSTPAPAPTQQNQPEPSWLRGRLEETRAAATRAAEQRFQQQLAQQQAQFEAVQRQLHALVGVQPQANPEVEAVKQQFEKLFPGLSKMEMRAQDLMGLLEQSQDFTQQNQHYWQSYGRQAVDRLFSLASKSLGSELSDDAKRALHTSFVGYVQSSPEVQERYMTDPSLIDEYWQHFSSTFIDPVRRSAAAGIEQQTAPRHLPQDTPGGVPSGTPAPRPQNLDERVAQSWAAFNANKNRP